MFKIGIRDTGITDIGHNLDEYCKDWNMNWFKFKLAKIILKKNIIVRTCNKNNGDKIS